MTHTTNYDLNKFEDSDLFDISDLNDNFDTIDAAFGGLKLRKLTSSAYTALTTKDDNTLYIVVPDPEVTP